MNKIWFSIVGIALVSRCPVSAQLEGPMITVVATSIETGTQSLIDGQDILRATLAPYQETLPASYRYINVLYTGTTLTSEQYELLQQSIYLGLIDNKKLTLRLSDGLTAFQARSLFKKWTGRTITTVSGNKPLTDTDRDRIVHRLQARYSVPSDLSFLNQDAQLGFVLSDAYRKIRHEYLHTDKVTDTQLVQGAIKGMVEATNDPYTTYFPPADAQQFIDSIQGEFFGIGAYIEMKGPGVLLIVSPLAGTPAERAGLLPGDLIMAIDGELIEETMSLSTAIAKIK